jgi:U3 small nucleolar RNA-associated protein 25
MVIVDRASTILLQNWLFLEEMFDNLNRIPKHEFVSNNLDQIRAYYFENKANLYRQNIVYTEFPFPELNTLRNTFFNNHSGVVQN